MEFKRTKIADVKAEGRTIVGYAAAFGNIDRVKDVIEPGAFAKTIREGKPKVGYNHMYMIGKPLSMEEDGKGLLTESYISDTPRGNEVLQLVKDGVIDAMSIAYEVIKSEDDYDKEIRHLKELKLYEYGPVDFPVNENAVINGVKQFAYDLEHGQSLTPDAIQTVKVSLKNLLRALEATEPDESTQTAEPTNVTQLKLVPPEWMNEIAESMRTRQEKYYG